MQPKGFIHLNFALGKLLMSHAVSDVPPFTQLMPLSLMVLSGSVATEGVPGILLFPGPGCSSIQEDNPYTRRKFRKLENISILVALCALV
jgi:hypothetical protein